MPYFRVLMRASGLDIPASEAVGPIAGFYTTRIVRAARASEAAPKAMALLTREWQSTPLATKSTRPHFHLSVDEVSQVPTLVGLFRRIRGYTFYSEE